MINLLLLIQSDTTKISTVKNYIINYSLAWFWIALVEFAVIIFLFICLRTKKSQLDFSNLPIDKIKNAQKTDIDMNNLMNSIHGSRELYKELSAKCHPDRFINTPEQKIAEELFQEISRDKRNYEKLYQLKKRAIVELNITF